MSNAAHSGRGGLDEWRAAQAAAKDQVAQRANRWMNAWASLLLIATLLYVLIGPTPYDHALVFDPLTGGAVISPVNRFIWLALLALAAPILVFRSDGLARFGRRLWPLLLLFGWFAATTSWAIDPAASHRRLFLYAVGLVICIAIRLGLPDGRRIHTALAWACAIIIAIDLGSWIVAPAASMTDLGLAAIHTHKNTLGAVMLFSLFVLAPYVLSRPTLVSRLAWTAVFLAGVVLMIASRSKTSLGIAAAAVVVGPLIVAAMRLRGRLLWGLAATVAAMLIAAAFCWLAWCGFYGADPFEPITKLSFTQRTDVWRFVFDQTSHRPLTGVGFGSFWDVDPTIQPSLQTDEWFAKPDAPTNEAHNGYLDIAATTGLPGLIGALILLFGWIGGGLSMLRRALLADTIEDQAKLPFALFLALFPLAFFVHNWMESSFFTANSTFGVIILLVGITIDMRDKAIEPDDAARSAPRSA